MGKHLKTSMDEKVIDYLAIELYKKDPLNFVLNKFFFEKKYATHKNAIYFFSSHKCLFQYILSNQPCFNIM